MRKLNLFTFVGCSLIATILPAGAVAQVAVPPIPAVYAITGPITIALTEHAELCAFSLGAIASSSYGPVSVTEEILDGVTGAVLAEKQITFPSISASPAASDPCLDYAPVLTPTAVTSGAATSPAGKLIVGVLLGAPQVTCSTCVTPVTLPSAPVVAALNVFTLATPTAPANIRSISLHPVSN